MSMHVKTHSLNSKQLHTIAQKGEVVNIQ
jgi:hypothetical protein